MIPPPNQVILITPPSQVTEIVREKKSHIYSVKIEEKEWKIEYTAKRYDFKRQNEEYFTKNFCFMFMIINVDLFMQNKFRVKDFFPKQLQYSYNKWSLFWGEKKKWTVNCTLGYLVSQPKLALTSIQSALKIPIPKQKLEVKMSTNIINNKQIYIKTKSFKKKTFV